MDIDELGFLSQTIPSTYSNYVLKSSKRWHDTLMLPSIKWLWKLLSNKFFCVIKISISKMYVTCNK